MRVTASSAMVAAFAGAAAGAAVPRDSNPGCQAASMGSFQWTVAGFAYNASTIYTTPAHSVNDATASFALENPALTYNSSCAAENDVLGGAFYGNQAYTCTEPANATDTTHTTFTFDSSTSLLSVNQTWECSDQDPQYPVTFTAYGSANLSLTCTENSTTNPDWQEGEIYSQMEKSCGPVTLTLKPSQVSAVA
ncbi:hypothetical protein GGR56DRAFT_672365 [Xylariaceae sp. FL0804]|nr:hypothetical protein GGR56DRAFT_672365 [Xylariaceae sp. FL0804]